jgi:hypothetical protein
MRFARRHFALPSGALKKPSPVLHGVPQYIVALLAPKKHSLHFSFKQKLVTAQVKSVLCLVFRLWKDLTQKSAHKIRHVFFFNWLLYVVILRVVERVRERVCVWVVTFCHFGTLNFCDQSGSLFCDLTIFSTRKRYFNFTFYVLVFAPDFQTARRF